MPRLLSLLLFLAAVAIPDARSQPTGQRFVSIAFHDVVDRPDEEEKQAEKVLHEPRSSAAGRR